MTETLLLEKCIELIEQRLQWGDRSTWTAHNFDVLSERLVEKTKIVISSRTLTRLFRKANLSDYKPQIATKDALAIFLDFKDWEDLKEKNIGMGLEQDSSINDQKIQLEEVNNSNSISKKIFNKKILLYSLLIILFCAIIILFYFKNKTSINNLTYSIDSTQGNSPFTLLFNYNAKKINDSIFIKPGMYRTYYLAKNDSVFSHCYLLPGVYNLEVYSKKRIFLQERVFVSSKDWESIISYDDGKLIPFSNRIVQPIDGRMYIDPLNVLSRKIDTNKVYWVHYVYYKKLNCNADNFHLLTRIKNNQKDGGMNCYDIILTIQGENNKLKIALTNKGCYRFVNLQFSEKEILGKNSDLSVFGQDMQEWGTFEIVNRYRKIHIFYNNNKIYSQEYEQPLGNILGISYMFKGCGSVDFVKLYNKDEELILDNDF